MRDALERFLTELAAQRRASPHTIAGYRRDIARALDLAGGGGRRDVGAVARPVAADEWTRELLERALRDLYRTR
ncbi:MAG: site-specific integrase, partial [Candidatus Eiseniibacteriota bacterium]